ncbi:hypothetical protein [Arthrobacter bambusae]|uniref:hypothetical protein n=1 Tax=Arthrobacter bambusae TaxID=1338426 RepID=UPI002788016F|nr:hypothetical protein [Arthrobacter bambusae]MDQ0032119.1 hypothetical protein [Arthrobacter bambusae]MDQ0100275.1 hypothetical protein [Arthrobacter bambusae]
MNMSLSLARAVADAVLYEGYLLYPYRASSQKNQSRWQFGILGPPGAALAGTGEEPEMFADCLLRPGPLAEVEAHLRFLQLQARTAEKADDSGGFSPVDELTIGAKRWLSWDEAVEQEVALGPFSVAELIDEPLVLAVEIAGGTEVEELAAVGADPGTAGAVPLAGRLVRRRRALHGEVQLAATDVGSGLVRLRVTAVNNASALPEPIGKQDAIANSFIGTHLLLSADDADFVSLLEPPDEALKAAQSCAQYRCWPVLAGPEGQRDVLLVSPIILYDHPALAPESSVPLYDSTEIDEILTLRVLTLTDQEKAEARATDPRAAAIIDRCEEMAPEELQQLHGILRNPHSLATDAAAPDAADLPWWEPEAEARVKPEADVVVINGVPVARGSRVRVNPRRRADAQDLFFAGQTGRVTSVHFDVDGSTHVGLVLEQDPAADLHEGYGRSFYYAPDELEPLGPLPPGSHPETQEGKEGP